MTAPTTSSRVPQKALWVRTVEFLARQRTFADIGVAVLVPATAAIAGLVLEDTLPVGATPQVFSAGRWTVMLALLVLLMVSVRYRRWVYHGTGTLYSLSFLDETMRDYHEQAREDAERRHMGTQWIGRRVDITSRECDGLVDVVQPRQELSRSLEDAMNRDRDDTGYALAPNMLWPAAIAVGASLSRADTMRFLDYDKETTVYRLRDRAAHRVAAGRDAEHVVERPTGDRHGVVLAFTPAASTFAVDQRCAEFGIRTLTTLQPGPEVRGRLLTGAEMSRLAEDLGQQLAEIKSALPRRELVVVAFVPKTVAVLTGWYLSRQQVRFFAGTHLMHYVQPEDRFVALRVHPSQPAAFPMPLLQR